VPLSTYVKKYAGSRFESSGMTEDPELRIATSLMDYIFGRIAVDYMDFLSVRNWGFSRGRSTSSRRCPEWKSLWWRTTGRAPLVR
jgi:ribonucleoside-diphosphate reductase alpha chain